MEALFIPLAILAIGVAYDLTEGGEAISKIIRAIRDKQ